MTTQRRIATPAGEAHLYVDRARRPVATLVLGHGAGRGVDAPDLEALAQALPKRGVSVLRIQQPWVVAGRRVAPRPETLDTATVSCLNAIRVRTPLFLGGRSAGARVACRLARGMGAVGCVALAFPLHPPGRAASGSPPSRLDELLGAGLPTLVVQGQRDAFGSPRDFPGSVSVVAVPDADHSFVVSKHAATRQDVALRLVVDAVGEWIESRVPARPGMSSGEPAFN